MKRHRQGALLEVCLLRLFALLTRKEHVHCRIGVDMPRLRLVGNVFGEGEEKTFGVSLLYGVAEVFSRIQYHG